MLTNPSLTLPRAQGARNICVAWLHPGDVTGAFARSLAITQAVDREHRITGVIESQSSPRIAEARNGIVSQFLDNGQCDWLLMVDADMAWTYEDFDRLCRVADPERRPIVGGLCFAGGWDVEGKLRIYPTIYKMTSTEDGLDSELIEDYPKDKLIRVGATGAAFLLVHKKVFIRMFNHLGKTSDGKPNPFPWFMETVLRGRPCGEDITFLVRATSLDFPVYVHTGVKIAHQKRYYLTEAEFDDHHRAATRSDRAGDSQQLLPPAV